MGSIEEEVAKQMSELKAQKSAQASSIQQFRQYHKTAHFEKTVSANSSGSWIITFTPSEAGLEYIICTATGQVDGETTTGFGAVFGTVNQLPQTGDGKVRFKVVWSTGEVLAGNKAFIDIEYDGMADGSFSIS